MLKSFFSKTSVFLFLVASSLFVSCHKDETYADHVKNEKKQVNSYLKSNNLVVTECSLNDLPEVDEWIDEESGSKIFRKFSNGLYFHQIYKGDTSANTLAPKVGCTVYMRYVGTNLNGIKYYDCTSLMSADPKKVTLLAAPTSSSTYGEGFQTALKQMRKGGHCICIIPFKIGNGNNTTISGSVFSDADQFMPVVYEIWVTNIE